ncbi:MAG: hypothetical protein MJE12_10185, partial [Alphaproteobacteria bacterium]|nr:hypothetical protein [Alphaproteobacteria bacterium]
MPGSSHVAASPASYTGSAPDRRARRAALPEATLVLLAPRRENGDGIEGDRVILGLSLLRRAVLAAQRAGFQDIRVVSDCPDLARAHLDGTSAVLEAPNAGLPTGRVVLMSGEVVATTRWFEALRAL